MNRSVAAGFLVSALAIVGRAGVFTSAIFLTYDGPPRPRAETAVLVTSWAGITVESVDGRSSGGNPLCRVYQFLPGRHSVGLSYNDGSVRSGIVVREFDAVAGHLYLVDWQGNAKVTFRHGVKGTWDPEVQDITAEIGSSMHPKPQKTVADAFRVGKAIRLSGGKFEEVPRK